MGFIFICSCKKWLISTIIDPCIYQQGSLMAGRWDCGAGRGELKLEHQTSTFPMFLSNFMAHKCVHAECASADVCLKKPISCF